MAETDANCRRLSDIQTWYPIKKWRLMEASFLNQNHCTPLEWIGILSQFTLIVSSLNPILGGLQTTQFVARRGRGGGFRNPRDISRIHQPMLIGQTAYDSPRSKLPFRAPKNKKPAWGNYEGKKKIKTIQHETHAFTWNVLHPMFLNRLWWDKRH